MDSVISQRPITPSSEEIDTTEDAADDCILFVITQLKPRRYQLSTGCALVAGRRLSLFVYTNFFPLAHNDLSLDSRQTEDDCDGRGRLPNDLGIRFCCT